MTRDDALSSLVTPVVLAGGLGTRLATALPEVPKVLAPVGGRPFLDHVLDGLGRAGFSRAVLCLGHRAEEVMAALGSRRAAPEPIFSVEKTPCGTAGAVRLALDRIDTPWLLVANGDSLVNTSPADYARWHLAAGHPASLLAVSVPDVARYGRLELAPDGRVRAFAEKDGRTGPGIINAGLVMLPRAAIEAVPPGCFVQLEEAVLPRLAAAGRLFAMVATAPFIDIGTPESYARINNAPWPRM